jgi:phosphoglycolate phosphatase-like HAD superfamily hydrolase
MTIARSLVIFDVEGTLVDSTALTMRCWQETLQSFGFEFPLGTLQRHSGRDGHDMLHALIPGPHVGRVVPRILEAQGQRYRDKYLPRVAAFPEVRALFERVKRAGQLIALATSASADELDHYLALTNTGDLVDAVACGEDVQHDMTACFGITPPARRSATLMRAELGRPMTLSRRDAQASPLSECCRGDFRGTVSRPADASRCIAIRRICSLAMGKPSRRQA